MANCFLHYIFIYIGIVIEESTLKAGVCAVLEHQIGATVLQKVSNLNWRLLLKFESLPTSVGIQAGARELRDVEFSKAGRK